MDATLLGQIRRHRVVVILALTLIISSLLVPGFFSPRTLSLGLDRSSAIGIVAIGMTVLLIAGQIDLSVGSVFAVSGIVAVALQPELGLLGSSIVGVLAGALAGAINGFIVVRIGVNSLVATLATMLIFRSIAHWFTDSQPLSGQNIMFSIQMTKVWFGVFTLRSALFVGMIIVLAIWLARTIPGRNMLAVGSNLHSAEASGIPAKRYLFLSFVFASSLAGLAGVLQSLVTNTGSPVYGAELTVAVIAAVVVGGTRLEGGKGSALGTLGGVLTVAALTMAMEFSSVPAYWQQVVSGLILILLIIMDRRVRSLTPRLFPGQPATSGKP